MGVVPRNALIRCNLFAALLAISMFASCRPEIPWGWKAHIVSDSLVVWLPSSYWTLPPAGDGPQFTDSSHSTYLQRVPAKQLYLPWIVTRATREGLLTIKERRTGHAHCRRPAAIRGACDRERSPGSSRARAIDRRAHPIGCAERGGALLGLRRRRRSHAHEDRGDGEAAGHALGKRGVRGGQPRDRHAEGRAAHVIHPAVVTEGDRARLAAVLAADADLEAGRASARPSVTAMRDQLADAGVRRAPGTDPRQRSPSRCNAAGSVRHRRG